MALKELQLVAKLSGSFALGGLVANQKTCTAPSDELPLALLSLLLPKKAYAYTFARARIPTSQSKSSSTFQALDADGRYHKVYPVELRIRSLSSQFEFHNLSMAVLRALVVTYAPMIESYFKDLQRLEKEAEETGTEVEWEDLPGFDWLAAKQRAPHVAFAMARDILVGTVRILLSWGAVAYLDSRLVWKLVKDQTASLRAKRRLPFYKRPVVVTRTVLRGLVIGTLAELIVGSAIEAARTLHSDQIPEHSKRRVLRRRFVARSLSLLVSMVTSSAAAGVVAVIQPGRLCIGATLAAGFATDVFICMPAAQEYESKGIEDAQNILLLDLLIVISRGGKYALLNAESSLQGRISRRAKVLLCVCSGVVLWSFYPWIGLPRTVSASLPQPALS